MEANAGGTRKEMMKDRHKPAYAQPKTQTWNIYTHTRANTRTVTRACMHTHTYNGTRAHIHTLWNKDTLSHTHVHYTHAHTPDLCSCKVQISKTEVKKRALKRGNNDTQTSHVRRTKYARKQSCSTNISTLHDLNRHIQQYLADKDSTTVTKRIQSSSIFKV